MPSRTVIIIHLPKQNATRIPGGEAVVIEVDLTRHSEGADVDSTKAHSIEHASSVETVSSSPEIDDSKPHAKR